MDNTHGRRRARRLSWLFCLTLTTVSVLHALLLVTVRRLVPESHLLGYLLVYAPQPPLLAPLGALALLCLLLRQPRLALVNMGVLGVAIVLVLPPVLPHRPPRHNPAQRLRVVTWNVHGEDRHLAEIQATLARLQPDVVCLQEAQEKAFAQALPGAQADHTHEVRTLTRGRIVSRHTFPLGSPGTWRWGLSTDIELPQGRLSVLNVHYVVGVRHHVAQARQGLPDRIEDARETSNKRVLAWLRETRGPRIVCGDFNTPPGARLYRDLRAEAQDAFGRAGLGWGFTFSRRRPMIRIDYVWCAGGVMPVSSRARDGEVSDHRLVVTDLILPR